MVAGARACVVPLALLVFSLPATAGGDLRNAAAIPHVGAEARATYQQYFLNAGRHRAFAIAPGGAWAWQGGRDSAEAARASALEECERHTQQRCMLYALDDEVVFTRADWAALWGPYLSAEEAAAAAVGTRVGERFPDIAFRTAKGAKHSIADLRGRVLLVHFWGSWCPPCVHELPTLENLQRILREQLDGKVELVLIQLREPFDTAQAWVQRQGLIELPLVDSGARGPEDDFLLTTGGDKIPDRTVARVFPSSYVLDRNGIVLFSHTGPVTDWSEYLPFFLHAAQ